MVRRRRRPMARILMNAEGSGTQGEGSWRPDSDGCEAKSSRSWTLRLSSYTPRAGPCHGKKCCDSNGSVQGPSRFPGRARNLRCRGTPRRVEGPHRPPEKLPPHEIRSDGVRLLPGLLGCTLLPHRLGDLVEKAIDEILTPDRGIDQPFFHTWSPSHSGRGAVRFPTFAGEFAAWGLKNS